MTTGKRNKVRKLVLTIGGGSLLILLLCIIIAIVASPGIRSTTTPEPTTDQVAIATTLPDAPTSASTIPPTPTSTQEVPEAATVTIEATDAPSSTITPSANPTTLPPVPPFQEIAEKWNGSTLTDIQKRAFLDGLTGRTISEWQGIITDVSSVLGTHSVWVDMSGTNSDRDVTFSVPKDEALRFYKGAGIRFSGKLTGFHSVLGFYASMDEVNYTLSEETLAEAPTSTLVPTAELTAPAQSSSKATAKNNGNLRSGPGTDFAVTGSVKAGAALDIVGRNQKGDWFRLADGKWIAAILVADPPSVPVDNSAPTESAVSEAPTAAPQPPQAPLAFESGVKLVGADIAPGTYRSMGGDFCYWERLSGFGGSLDEIIANDSAAGPTVVTIASTDKGFNSVRCGRWVQVGEPITSSPTAPFGQGTFIVSNDIAPGTWRSSGGELCYWERLAGFSGELRDIIANDNVSGSTIVTIAPSDVGFNSARCGTWTKAD